MLQCPMQHSSSILSLYSCTVAAVSCHHYDYLYSKQHQAYQVRLYTMAQNACTGLHTYYSQHDLCYRPKED